MQFNLGTLRKAVNLAQRAYREYQKIQGSSGGTSHRTKKRSQRTSHNAPSSQNAYPGDYTGPVNFTYAPDLDGAADPGEVVWTWVPYEEDYSQGKDRPVLLIGHDREYLLALMLTSKDKNNSTQHNPHYLDIGSGDWDRSGRDSEVKLDRVIRVLPSAMRREGAVMDEATFRRIEKAFNRSN